MAQKKTKLSIYLIKEGFDEEQSILVENKKFEVQIIPNVGNLYHTCSFSFQPKWVNNFFGEAINGEEIFNASASAVLLIPIITYEKTRYFALTFGRGYSLLNTNAIEGRFGLKTALNNVKANSIRRISKTVIAGNASKSNEQMPKKTEIHDFALDIERDLLNGVTASGDDESLLSGTITGADALNIPVSIPLSEIPAFLVKVFSLYESNHYKENFPWIDHIEAIKNKTLKKKLDEALVDAINRGDIRVWMAVPEVIDWETTAGFRYQGSQELHDDILIDEVLKTLRNTLENIDQLKRKTIFQIGVTEETDINHWPANKCIYGELDFEDHQYCINGGEWFRVDPDYVKQINKQYEATTLASFPFPEYSTTENGEGSYNRRVCEDNAKSCILMDQKFIMHGGANSKFELCDILVRDGSFIHVKKYSGSATLSHLFNQGLTTAELIKSDAVFLQKANAKIAEECHGAEGYRITNMQPNLVIFGIITKDRQPLPDIPFFSKITFCAVKKHLSMMNIEVAIAAIPKN